MKKAAVTATFAVLVVVGHASCGVAAEDDLPDEAAIADRRILAVDDGMVPFLADQPFTRENGVEAFVLDAFEQGLSERSLLTLPMLKTEEALARVAAEADLSDEATVAEQRLLARDEEGKRLVAYQPSTGIDVEAVQTNEFGRSGIGEAESALMMLEATSSAAFTWQGRFKATRVPDRTLRRGSFRPTFATLSGVDRTYDGHHYLMRIGPSRPSASPYSLISSARTSDRQIPALIRPSVKYPIFATMLAELER